VAEKLPFTYTGADFYALCSDAMLKAVTRQATLVDNKIKTINATRSAENQSPISTAYFFDHYATKEDVAVMVTEQDFLDAHRELIPSVSAGELAHYEHVRAMFEGSGSAEEANKKLEEAAAAGAGAGGAGVAASMLQKAIGPGGSTLTLGGGKRTLSGLSAASGRRGSKGKGKGKGKAVALDSDDEYSDDEDVNDGVVNGGSGGVNGKGKGNAVAASPFHDGADDDEGLYD